MPTTITSNVTFPGVQEWADEHGIDPRDYAATVTIEDDGNVTLLKRKRNAAGHIYAEPGTDTIAAEPVTITALRPFPH